MVPIWGCGLGSTFVGRAVYFASMASVGRKEVFIFLRLDDGQSDGTSWRVFRYLGKQTLAHR